MRILAEHTCGIREFDIKGFILKLGVIKDDMDYFHLLEVYKDPASDSKEAKIEAILRKLNGNPELAIFVNQLAVANNLENEEIEDINRSLALDGLYLDKESKTLKPETGHANEEEIILSKLDESLKNLSEEFFQMHSGIWDAVSSGGADKYRGAVASCRELLRQVIDKLASSGKTRAEKLKSILGSTSRAQMCDSVANLVNELYGFLSNQEHTTPSYEDAIFAVRLTEYTLYYLMFHADI
jgi:uncharacterized protein YcgL (UPF0745 family)